MEGGYKVDFKEPLPDHFKCLVCNLVLKEPKQTLCGHRFCEVCLEIHIGTRDEFKCPYEKCQDTLSSKNIYKDMSAKREISQLKVVCACSWEGTWKDCDRHVREACQLAVIKCCNDICEEELQRLGLQHHLENECPGRMVTCNYCQQEYAFIQQQVHESEICHKVPVSCPHNCSDVVFPKEQLTDHLEDCMLVPTKCPFSDHGCQFQGTREAVDQHMHNGSAIQQHMQCLLMYSLQVDVKCTTNKRELTELQNEKPILESKFGVVVEDFGEMRKQIRELQKQKSDMQKSSTQKDDKIKELEEEVQKMKELPAKVKKCEKEMMEMRKEIQWLEEQNLKIEEEIRVSCRPPPAHLRMQMMKDGIDYLETKETEKKRSNGCVCSKENNKKPVVLSPNAHGILIGKKIFPVLQDLKIGSEFAGIQTIQYAQFTANVPLKNLSREELGKQITDLCGENAEHLLQVTGHEQNTENMMKLAHLLILRANDEILVGDCELDADCEGAVGGDDIANETDEDMVQRVRMLEKRMSDVEKISTTGSLTGTSYSTGGGEVFGSPKSLTHTTEITYSTVVKTNMDSSILPGTGSVTPTLSPVPRQSPPKLRKQTSRGKTPKGACYGCNKKGHFVADCPNKKKK